MIWYMVPVLLTIHLLAYTTISAQRYLTIRRTLPTQKTITISKQEPTTIGSTEELLFSTQESTTVSTQELTTISAPENTTTSMQEPITIFTQEPRTLSTQKPTTVSTQKLTTISAPENTTTSMQKPITIFTQEPRTLSTQKPTTISTQEPTTISIQELPTISKQEPTTISTQEPTTVYTQELTTISTQETTTNSIPEISKVFSILSTESEDPTNSTNESNSQTSSSDITFFCMDGTPIGKEAICDGEIDCPDGSDEKNCGAEAKKEWKNLRNGYREAKKRTIKRSGSGRSYEKIWKYYDMVRFTEEYTKDNRKTISNIPAIPSASTLDYTDDTEFEQRSDRDDLNLNDLFENTTRLKKKKLSEESEIVKVLKENLHQRERLIETLEKNDKNKREDELRDFCNSLYQSLKKLPRLSQLKLKRILMEMVIKVEEEVELSQYIKKI